MLIVIAAAVELMDVLFDRPAWLGEAATSLYIAGAVAAIAAYFTGAQAASTVLIPSMAHPFVAEHRSWALVTTWSCAAAVVIRFAARAAGVPRERYLAGVATRGWPRCRAVAPANGRTRSASGLPIRHRSHCWTALRSIQSAHRTSSVFIDIARRWNDHPRALEECRCQCGSRHLHRSTSNSASDAPMCRADGAMDTGEVRRTGHRRQPAGAVISSVRADRMPTYYFPQADVRMETLSPGAEADAAGEVSWRNVQVGDRIAADAAWIALKPPASLASLTGHVSFAWHEMDGWFEEEEEVFVHARDPHQRVDVVSSSRHVRIVVNGETIAGTAGRSCCSRRHCHRATTSPAKTCGWNASSRPI